MFNVTMEGNMIMVICKLFVKIMGSLFVSVVLNFSQNDKVVRKIRSINNIIWTLMSHASLPSSF